METWRNTSGFCPIIFAGAFGSLQHKTLVSFPLPQPQFLLLSPPARAAIQNVPSTLPSLHNSWQRKEELQSIISPSHVVKQVLSYSREVPEHFSSGGQSSEYRKLSQITREQLRFTSLLEFFHLEPCKAVTVLFEVYRRNWCYLYWNFSACKELKTL